MEFMQVKEKAFKLVVKMVKNMDFKIDLQESMMPTVTNIIE